MTKRTRFPAGALGATLALTLAACGGGSGTAALPGLSGSQTSVDTAAARSTFARFKIVLHRHRRKKRRAGYVPPTTASAAVAVGKLAPVTVNLTAGSPGCTRSQPVTCSFDVPAPVGNDAFTVTLYGAKNAGGSPLAVGQVTQKIVQSKLNRITVVCDGVVASLGLALGQSTPVNGIAASIPLTIRAFDADSNTIISPGDYENPITASDSDTAHTQLQLGSGTPGSSVSVGSPGQTLDVLYDGSTALTSATLTASVPGAPGVTPATATLTPVAPQIAVDTANGLASPIPQDLLGANLPAWIDDTQSYIKTAMTGAGLHLVRWPGGSLADDYHWGDDNGVPTTPCAGAYADLTDSTFDNFMTYAVPAGADVAITVNYGSNIACNGPGTAGEAGDWAAYAQSKGYNVKYWTVGNENYGTWETDMHPANHQWNPTQYGSEIQAYASAIKTGYPGAKVGAVVGGPAYYGTWDNAMIAQANNRFDYVEYHYYAQQGVGAGTAPGDAESDTYLLGQGVTDFANALTALRTELTTDGVSTSVPIYLGELNSIVSAAGKQTVSITNGLFAGMAMAEVMKQPGVQMASWWLANGDCEDAATGGNFSSSLYGFQDFGTYTLFSDQSSGCGSENLVPAGTPFPDGRAYAIVSQFAAQGSTIRNVASTISTTTLRAYADTLGTGYGVLLFNLDENEAQTYTVALDNTSQQRFTATQIAYGKAQYDQTNGNPSAFSVGPVTTSLGTLGPSFSVTLPPWSMNLVTLVPVSDDARRRARPHRPT